MTRESMSNGSLMRITPLAVWSQNLGIEEIAKCVEQDVSKMHARTEMWDIVTAYCIGIKTLIKNAGDEFRAKLALDAITEFAQGKNRYE